MHRRRFIELTAVATATGASAPGLRSSTPEAPSDKTILVADLETHQRRIAHLAECDRRIRACLRKRTAMDYLPGQVVYNLGEYPCRKPWEVDDWDVQQLKEYSDAGIQLVQVHEEWNDSQRLFGADKFTPLNEKGFRRFVAECHRHGLKIIPYISTGYFESSDPDYRPEWAKGKATELYYSYARCLPESPGWRAYLLPRLKRILDEYGVDGFYNDVGYAREPLVRNSEDEGSGARAAPNVDAAFEDLLGIVYDEVKRRGGIVKVHAGIWYRGAQKPPLDPKLYDYLWVGESPENPDKQRENLKDHPPYVVPCLDLARTGIAHEDDQYLHSIPYLQFPVLLAGRPFTGERLCLPGYPYKADTARPGAWTRARHAAKIWDFHRKNPNGPYSYGWWDSFPGRPEARPTYYRWLKMYRAMVEQGTVAYIEVSDSDLFSAPLPPQVVASVFANRSIHVALANYSNQNVVVETSDVCRSCAGASDENGRRWTLKARSLSILQRV